MPEEVNNPVLDNLSASENKLQEVNGQLDSLVTEYNKVTAGVSDSSFFDLNNVYFWLVLAGLVLLAFGLWFLMSELKYHSPSKRPKKVQRAPEPDTIRSVVKQETEKTIIKTEPKKRKKPVKIRVVKIK